MGQSATTVQQLIDELMLIEDKSIRVDILIGDEYGNDIETPYFQLFSAYDDYVELYVNREDLGL